MISLHLNCDRGHAFDSLFQSLSSFDSLKAGGLLSCIHCNSTNIERGLSAPFVQTNRKSSLKGENHSNHELRNKAINDMGMVDSGQSKALTQNQATTALQSKEMEEKIKAFQAYIESTHENVGNAFPEMARKIHYGEAPKREILGQASLLEVKELVEEGIGILPLPFISNQQKN